MANDTPLSAAVLHALADPTRRAIVERLCQRSAPVGVLAAGLPISRPAVSQHLKVLREAGLLCVHAEGTRRIYAIDATGFIALRAYLDGLWDDAFTAVAPLSAPRRPKNDAAR